MRKKITFLLSVLAIYSNFVQADGIHETYIQGEQCFNLAVYTKLGMLVGNTCNYVPGAETASQGYDYCGPFVLNGALLETKFAGYQCAATVVRSNLTGLEAMDEYRLVLDENGHYTSSVSAVGKIVLRVSH